MGLASKLAAAGPPAAGGGGGGAGGAGAYPGAPAYQAYPGASGGPPPSYPGGYAYGAQNQNQNQPPYPHQPQQPGYNPSPYSQPASYQSYAAPSPSPYGQPTQSPYGQPPQSPYGQPAQSPYGQPAQSPYGQQQGGYSRPPPPPPSGPTGLRPSGQTPYGQPSTPQPGYGQSAAQSYGQPSHTPQPYGQPAPPPRADPYGQPSQQQPYGQSPFNAGPGYGHGQHGYPPQGAPPGQGYGAPPPGGPPPGQQASPARLQAFKQMLGSAIQENQLHNFYPPNSPALDQIAQRASVQVAQLCQRWRLPQEIGNDIVKLGLFDIILYIDDSGSMQFEENGERIKDLKLILERVAFAATLFDDDGISVRFMNSMPPPQVTEHIRTEQQVDQLMSQIQFKGLTPMGSHLKERVIDEVLRNARAGQLRKPVLVITITDGQPAGEPQNAVFETIKNATSEIGRMPQYGPGAIKFQFAQVGNDEKAREFLSKLDQDPMVGHLVDCTSNYENESAEMARANPPVDLTPELWLVKLLLGAIDKSYDRQDEKSNAAPPPGQYGAPQGGYGAPPPGQYGQPPQGYNPQGPQGGYGAPPPGQYGAPPQGGQYGRPPPGQPGYPPQQGGYPPQQGGYPPRY